MKHVYSNPALTKTVTDWPFGRELRTTATFCVETDHRKGQRTVRRTIDPRDGRLSAPKKLTFSDSQRIVDGDDSRTYIITLSSAYGFFGVMQGNMKYTEETIHESSDPEGFAALSELFKLENLEVAAA